MYPIALSTNNKLVMAAQNILSTQRVMAGTPNPRSTHTVHSTSPWTLRFTLNFPRNSYSTTLSHPMTNIQKLKHSANDMRCISETCKTFRITAWTICSRETMCRALTIDWARIIVDRSCRIMIMSEFHRPGRFPMTFLTHRWVKNTFAQNTNTEIRW